MSTIGLDVGTSRVKAVRFDDAWHAVDSATETTRVTHPIPGHREQDMDEVWTAAARVVAAVAGRAPDPVRFIAVTAQGDGCWLVDRHGAPVGPAILWNDARAGDILTGWQRDGTLDEAFRATGSYGAPGLAHAQLRWLLAHRPAMVDSAGRLLSCGSWIHHRLTGRLVVERSDAANPFLNARTGQYDDRLLDLFGLTSLRRLLPSLVDGTDRFAPLHARAAPSVGLPAGIPVYLAPYDVVATATGTGAVAPGDAMTVLGTTLCAAVVDADPRLDREPNGMALPAGTPGRWLLAYATMTGTEVLDWATALCGLGTVDDFVALAATARAPDRPLFLPYLSASGERSPFVDPHIRGSLHGLHTGHSPADIARAVLDGLSLAVRDCLHAAGRPTTLALAGGGTRSELWCQTISDATGVPVTCPDTPEVGAHGAVLLAAVDDGTFAGIDEAARIVRHAHHHTPDPAETARFNEVYPRYRALRE